MRVLRVEDNEAVGPYTSYWYSDWSDRDHCSPLHPAPHRDGISSSVVSSGVYYCGFLDEAHLEDWFNKNERARLHDLGFHLAIYEVDSSEVFIGRKQLMFRKEAAQKVRRKDLV